MITSVVFIYSTSTPHSLLRTVITDDADHAGTPVAQRPECLANAGEAQIVMPYAEFLTLPPPIETAPALVAAIAAAIVAVTA